MIGEHPFYRITSSGNLNLQEFTHSSLWFKHTSKGIYNSELYALCKILINSETEI